jgi:hypothetical protein
MVCRSVRFVRVVGPLAEFTSGVISWLVGQGYSVSSQAHQVEVLSLLSRWMQRQAITVADLNDEVVMALVLARRSAGVSTLNMKSFRVVLAALRSTGLVVESFVVPAAPPTSLDVLLREYRRYLLDVLGLSVETIQVYTCTASLGS